MMEWKLRDKREQWGGTFNSLGGAKCCDKQDELRQMSGVLFNLR